MTVFFGEVKRLSECSPGDLIRLPRRGLSTFAFAAQSTHVAEPSRFVALNGTECGFVYEPDEDLMLLSYGKGYRIEPSPDSHSALDVGSAFNQGRIVCNRPRNGTPPSSHMMCMNQRGNVTFYDLDAGTLGQEPGGKRSTSSSGILSSPAATSRCSTSPEATGGAHASCLTAERKLVAAPHYVFAAPTGSQKDTYRKQQPAPRRMCLEPIDLTGQISFGGGVSKRTNGRCFKL